MKTKTEQEIRAECREMFYSFLPRLREIAESPDTSTTDRIYAIEVMARYGVPQAQEWPELSDSFEEPLTRTVEQ